MRQPLLRISLAFLAGQMTVRASQLADVATRFELRGLILLAVASLACGIGLFVWLVIDAWHTFDGGEA